MRQQFMKTIAILALVSSGVISSNLYAQQEVLQDQDDHVANSALDPKADPAETLVAKALVAFRKGDGNEAMSLFVSAHETNANLPPGEIMFAYLAFRAGQTKAGLNSLEVAAVRHPSDPEPWSMLGDIALRENRLAESSVLFDKALDLAKQFDGDPRRKSNLLISCRGGLASIYEQRRDWKTAEKQLRGWIKLDERNPVPWQRLARVFFATERFELAKKTLDKVFELDSGGPASEIMMGLMYQRAGDTQKAEQLIRQALDLYPNDFPTQFAAAQWAMSAGENDLLQKSVSKAKELRPDAAGVDGLRGMAEQFAGAPAKAELIYAEMLVQNPASFDAMNGVALSLLAQDDEGKHRKALQQAQVLVERNSNLQKSRGRIAAATYAWALHRLGQNSEAQQVIKRVITSGDISSQVSFFAASILHEAGEDNVAKQLLTASLEDSIAFPEEKIAEELLKELTAE